MHKPNPFLDALFIAALTCVGLICIAGIGKLLSFFSPIFTILVVIMLTTRAFENRTATLLALGGIGLYFAAWPVSWILGPAEGIAVFSIGLCMWLLAVLNPRSSLFAFSRPTTA